MAEVCLFESRLCCFGFASVGFDRCPEHRGERVGTVRAGAAKGSTFAPALVVDGRYLCSCARVHACESRVSAG